MVTYMNEKKIRCLDNVRTFLAGTMEVEFSIKDKTERSRYRGRVVPGRRGRVSKPASLAEESTPAERRASMTRAQRL